MVILNFFLLDPPPPAAAPAGSWLSWLWKRTDAPGPIKASLGEETSFYYDKELKRWVNKKVNMLLRAYLDSASFSSRLEQKLRNNQHPRSHPHEPRLPPLVSAILVSMEHLTGLSLPLDHLHRGPHPRLI